MAVYDYGEAGGYPFLVMEYVEGVTLRQLLQSQKLTPEEALEIVPKICEALQFAHSRGIVHRDIKPENILLDKIGQVKITDFGIAKIIHPGAPDRSLTGAKDVMGTPHYMAPEQIEQPAKVDHRADIYSLGVVFYEMLTGELPLGKFQAPSNKVQLDIRLDEVVLRALAKEPERRYQHAGEVKTAVETIVASGEQGRTSTPPQPCHGKPGSASIPIKTCLSRAGIIGAGWILLFFATVPAFLAHKTVLHDLLSHGISPLAAFITFTVVLPAMLAPLGATILGWIAVMQIRRSAGRLHGLGLALFDGLLFPLLALTGMITGFWRWVIMDVLYPTQLRSLHLGGPGVHLSRFEDFIFSHGTALIVLSIFITSGTLCALIVRRVWRAVNKPPTEQSPPLGHSPLRPVWAALVAVMLFAVGTGLLMWLQHPVPLDKRITSESPDRQYLVSASTWRAMRVFGADRLTYRFDVSRRGADPFDQWEIPVPLKESSVGWYSFQNQGSFRWSADNKRVAFLVHDKIITGFNTQDQSHSAEEGFLPVRKITLKGRHLPDFFLDLDTGRSPNIPKELVDSSRTSLLLGNSPLSTWMRTNGLDFTRRTNDTALLLVEGISVMIAEKTGPHAKPQAFDLLSTTQVIAAVEAAARAYASHDGISNIYRLDARAVYAFQTRERSAGLIEVVEEDQRSGLTRFRFKFVDAASGKQAGGPQATEFKAIPAEAVRLVEGIQGLGKAMFTAGQENDLIASMSVRRDLEARKEALSVQLQGTAAEKPMAEFLETVEGMQRAFAEQRFSDARKLADESTAKGGILEQIVRKEAGSTVTQSKGTPDHDVALGPVIERVISQSDADAQGFVFFSLQTGQSLKPPSALSQSVFGSPWDRLAPELQQWIRTNELDLLFRFQDKRWALRCLEMDEQPLGAPDYWERVTANDVATAFNRGYSTYGQMLRGGPFLTAAGAPKRFTPCSAFRTRHKAIGAWQVAGLNATPRAVKIRYRLVQPAQHSTNASTAKPTVTQIHPWDPKRLLHSGEFVNIRPSLLQKLE